MGDANATRQVERGAENGTLSSSSTILGPTGFDSYVSYLTGLLHAAEKRHLGELSRRILQALDGEPAKELRRRYSSDLLRRSGTFFTGSDLASRLVAQTFLTSTERPLLLDPDFFDLEDETKPGEDNEIGLPLPIERGLVFSGAYLDLPDQLPLGQSLVE